MRKLEIIQQNIYAKSRGNYMVNRNPEVNTGKAAGKGESKAATPFPSKDKIATIKDVQDLERFMNEFTKVQEQAPHINPFAAWATPQIEACYLNWSLTTARLEKQKPDFGKKESIAAVAQPYNSLMIDALQSKGADIRGLFLEAVEMSARAGLETRSVGAATIDADSQITDPSLRMQMNILNRLLEEIPDEDSIRQVQEMDKALGRISTASGVDQHQREVLVERILDRMAPLKGLAEEQEIRSMQHQQLMQREKAGKHFHVVKAEDSADFDPTKFKDDPEALRSANELKNAIREGKAGNDFLKDKIEELLQRQNKLQEDEDRTTSEDERARLEKAVDEIKRLRGVMLDFKQLINARETEDRLKEAHTDWSTYGEIRMLPEEKAELVELVLKGDEQEVDRRFARLFHEADTRTGDDWNEAQGSRGQIEVTDFTTALSLAASGRMTLDHQQLTKEQIRKLDKVSRRLSQEVKLREHLHNLSYYVNKNFGIEEIHKLMKTFSAEDADLAYSIKGVTQIGHFFEQAMLEIMARNGGYLPAETMVNKNDGSFGEVEVLVRDQIDKAIKMGTLEWNPDKDHWEIDRAVSMARGMGIATGRTFEIVAVGGIPPAGAGGVLVSWYANDIIKKIAFFRQIARYDVGKERNRFMAFKMEGTTRAWHTKELSELEALNDAVILNKFVNESDEDRWIDQVNPGQVGSIFYQTGWRYGEDKINHAGAIAHLLDGYRFNPIIGTGMWVERQRRQLGNTKKLSDQERQEVIHELGVDLGGKATVGDRAALIISKNLDLSAKITPLKLFHNMIGLKQQVLRNHYGESITEDLVADEKTGRKKPSGRVIITDENLKDDLSTLSILQEKILRRRAHEYRDFLEGRRATRPDLYNEYTDLDGEIRDMDNSLFKDPGQKQRIMDFMQNVRNEFYKPSQKDRLIANLKDKGWKVPFIFGTDDLPFDLYHFNETGPSSFGRRWGDIASVAGAADVFENKFIRQMANFKDQDTLVGSMAEIYNVMVGHDEGRTRDFMLRMTEGVIKFYKKDITTRLPVGIGMAEGMLHGKASYAEIAFGRDQMAWDEIDIDSFVRKVRSAGLIDSAELGLLRKKTGSQYWNLGLAVTRTAVPLGILGFIYYMLTAELDGLGKAA
ncbi:hypothetical protein C4559_01375 [Candidatus Microgenomates bacterium]|nr:MAG: hypothetical protein C4559_01375 [Candidatus Microgenomates bacterium]